MPDKAQLHNQALSQIIEAFRQVIAQETVVVQRAQQV